MNATQVMTRQPVTAGPAMPVRDVARLLPEHRISAVPVVDASGALLGIVSEGDLVRRGDVVRDDRQSWWLQMIAEGEGLASEFLAYVRRGRRRRSRWPAPAPRRGHLSGPPGGWTSGGD